MGSPLNPTQHVPSPLRVGALSRVSGLTVRTLHYYDEIGLVRARRDPSGHRLYDTHAIERLYRIQLMRSLGHSLAEIERALSDESWDPAKLARQRAAELDHQIADQARLRDHLARVGAQPGPHRDLPTMLRTLKELTVAENPVLRRIPTLVYEDVAAAHDYLVDVFGFDPGLVDRDSSGVAVHAEVHAGDGVIWLHRVSAEFDLATPRSLGAETAGISVIVDDVDAHHSRALAAGATIRYEPTDEPYGYREYAAVDLDGRLWAFMAPIG